MALGEYTIEGNDTFMSIEFWFSVLFLGCFAVMGVSWILFARLSMARIERAMEKDGAQKKFQWDGVGGRIVFYALVIVLPENKAERMNQLIDVALVRKYALRRDKVLGNFFLVSSNIAMLIALLAVVLSFFDENSSLFK